MALDKIIAKPIAGIDPFDELPVDANLWRESHDYHRQHRVLHSVSSHRPGIVTGLDVFVSGKNRTVTVSPGVGIDSEGRTLILSEKTDLELKDSGDCFVTIAFQKTTDPTSERTVKSGKRSFRFHERRIVDVFQKLPAGPHLELARVDRSTKVAAIKEPIDRFDPGEDELNLMHRQIAFPNCPADGALCELFLQMQGKHSWKPNRAGLTNLIQESNAHGFHVWFGGLFNPLSIDLDNLPLLVYVAGAGSFLSLEQPQIDGIKAYLAEGGLLVGEASQGAEAFAKGFQDLAGKLGAKLTKVEPPHPLLTSYHTFPTVPPGWTEKGGIDADIAAGVLLTSCDFGAAWQGQFAKSESATRERVRSAQEFGLNIMALAMQRRRAALLRRL